MVARINESLPETARETVTNQPDDCDPAVTVLSFALTKEQLIAICRAVLGETLTGLDNLFFGDEVLGGLTDIFCAQLVESAMDGDVPVMAYLDADGGIVKLIITGGAEETGILTRRTSDEGVLYHLSMETTTESTGWRGCVLRGRPQSRPRTPELGAKQGANDVPTDEHGDGKRRDHADGSARH